MSKDARTPAIWESHEMQLKIRISGDEAKAVADAFATFIEEQLGAVPEKLVEQANSRWRGQTTEVIVLVATVLQGSAAALYLTKELEATRRISDLLGRLRSLLRKEGKVAVEIDEGRPISFSDTKPDKILDLLQYKPPEKS